MNLLKITTLFAVVLFAVAGQASAVTLAPDYRGDENSVQAAFEWVGGDLGWVTRAYRIGPSSFPLSDIDFSAFDEGPDTIIQLPNFIDPLPMKKMRIAMFFDGPVPGELIRIDLTAHDPLQTSWNIVGGSGPISSNEHFIDIEIYPNPDWEEFTIFGEPGANIVPGNLMMIEVDTVSIPEPASMAMLCVGAVAILRRRRK